MKFLKAFLKDAAGLTTLDYGLLALGLAGIAVSVIVILDPELGLLLTAQ